MSSRRKKDKPLELPEPQPLASTSKKTKKKKEAKSDKKSTEEQEQLSSQGQPQASADQQDQSSQQSKESSQDSREECHMVYLLSEDEVNEACHFIRHHEFIFNRAMKYYGNKFELDEAFTELALLLQKDKYQLVKWYNAMVKEYEDIFSYMASNPDTYVLGDFTEMVQTSFSFLRDHQPALQITLETPQSQSSDAPELESSYLDLGSDSSEEY